MSKKKTAQGENLEQNAVAASTPTEVQSEETLEVAPIDTNETLETAPVDSAETLETAPVDSVETIEVTAPILVSEDMETPRKYRVNESEIDSYLAGPINSDSIVQVSRGGVFVSSGDKNKIYIPLSLIKV